MKLERFIINWLSIGLNKLRYTPILSFALLFLVEPAFAESTLGDVENVIFSSQATTFFIVTILSVTIYLGHVRYTRFSIVHGPEILTTLGIMGCFFGIAIALLHFDTSNIQNSVPLLLEGVRTAFWSSLFGVSGALYIRFLHHFRKPPKSYSNPNEIKTASLDDVVSSMVALRSGLVGDEEGTLLTQIKLQRQESKDKLDELVKEFKNFAHHMVENNQKALIEALRQVISDFNQNLTDQFGENFKQLNLAVEKLVIWQEQYRQELDQIKTYQKQTADDLHKASVDFSDVIKKAESFAAISESLRSQLELMEQQRETIFAQEKALSEVLSSMKEVTPEFAEKVGTMLSELNTGVQRIQSEVSSVVKNLGAQIQSSNAELKNLLSETLTKSQNEVGESLKSHVTTLKEGVIALDTALQKELNNSLESLGRQLASLSNKFVEDYTPLTDRLRKLVVELSGN